MLGTNLLWRYGAIQKMLYFPFPVIDFVLRSLERNEWKQTRLEAPAALESRGVWTGLQWTHKPQTQEAMFVASLAVVQRKTI